MVQRKPRPLSGQVELLWRQFAQAPGLPFADLLSADAVQEAFRAECVRNYDCVYTPLTTVRMLLSQAMDPDPSLRQAVSRLLAERAAAGRAALSADTGAYSQARQRLPECVLPRLTRQVGAGLLHSAPSTWLWKRRPVKLVDGTTVSLFDTPDNQAAYPQPSHEKPGLGFPLARLVVVFSLEVGTVLDAAIGPCAGKRTGELALFRGLHESLEAGDVVLADRYYCSYFEIAALQHRGCDVVMRLHHRRPVDFRKGKRLGSNDHVIVWTKPKRPAWMDEASYARVPDTLELREVRLRGTRPGFRTQAIVVVTTLKDPRTIRRSDLTDLYRMRWNAELDLRSLKQTMQMSILRSKSPAMVRKELWAHFLAYNLIRTVMAQAARQHHLQPREISFKGTVQTLIAFTPQVLAARSESLPALARRILAAIAEHRVADRPDRYEPRARKRRYDNFMHLLRPRAEAKALLLKGVCEECK
jgi:DDE family transposase